MLSSTWSRHWKWSIRLRIRMVTRRFLLRFNTGIMGWLNTLLRNWWFLPSVRKMGKLVYCMSVPILTMSSCWTISYRKDAILKRYRSTVNHSTGQLEADKSKPLDSFSRKEPTLMGIQLAQHPLHSFSLWILDVSKFMRHCWMLQYLLMFMLRILKVILFYIWLLKREI